MNNKEIIQKYQYYLDKILGVLMERQPSKDWNKEQFIEYLKSFEQPFEHISKKIEILADAINVDAKFHEDKGENIQDPVGKVCPACNYYQAVSYKELIKNNGMYRCKKCKSKVMTDIKTLPKKYIKFIDHAPRAKPK